MCHPTPTLKDTNIVRKKLNDKNIQPSGKMLSCCGNIEMIHPRRKQFKDFKTFHNHPKSPKSQPIQHWSWQCMDFHTLNTLYIIFQDRELSLYCFHVCHFFQKLSVTFVSYSLSDDSLCSLNSLSFFQPNKLRHILKFMP